MMKNRKNSPPRIARRIISRLSHYEKEHALADAVELDYSDIRTRRGAILSWFWYWSFTAQTLFYYIKFSLSWSIIMLKNYIKITLRNMEKHKVYSLIKIMGLSLAISCSFLAYLHIKSELSYDDFHQNRSRLFRIIRVLYNQEDYSVRHRDPSLPAHLGSLLPHYFPEIQSQSRYTEFITGIVSIEDRVFQEILPMADASFFEIFSFPLITGDPKTVLSNESNIVLTQSCARKYFHHTDPMGKRLTITRGDIKKDFYVSGIASDPPKNSIFQFSLLIPIDNLPAFLKMPELFTVGTQGVWPFPIFIQLKPGVQASDLEERFPAFTAQYFDQDIERHRDRGNWSRPEVPFSFGLQNIRNVYLDPSVYLGKGLTESLILSGIALLILLMAGINFTSLSLGTASTRAKEIGVRKVIGAERRQIIQQFWGETTITICGAALMGIGLAAALVPTFSQLIGKNYALSDLLSLSNLFALTVVLLITTALTASYPSLVMASFRPVEIIKGKFRFSRKKIFTRVLVVFQFTLSAILIIMALVFQRQMRVLNEKDLGYSREGLLAVITLENNADSSHRLVALYREHILQNPHVLSISASSAVFGLSPAPRQDTYNIDCHWNGVDSDFFRTIGAKIVSGEDFRTDQFTNSGTTLVNESFVRAFGVESPVGMTIGQAISINEPEYDIPDSLQSLVIRGVAEDFHFAPLEFGIFPAIFHTQPTTVFSRILIRVSTSSLSKTLKFLEQQWQDICPDKPFTYYFQDEALHELLLAERRWTRIVSFCSLLAILLASMGIFGLTSISINSRVKEIGIRKTFGAPSSRIIRDAYLDILGPVATAIALSLPGAFYLLQKTLQKFPYRINIPTVDFLLGAILTLAIATSTTLFLVLKAASASPVASLHQE